MRKIKFSTYRATSNLRTLAKYLVWSGKPFTYNGEEITFQATDNFMKVMCEIQPSIKKIKFDIIWQYVI